MRSLIWRWWAFAKKRQIKSHAKLTSYTVVFFVINQKSDYNQKVEKELK